MSKELENLKHDEIPVPGSGRSSDRNEYEHDYIFAASDEESWMGHLDQHGYCVLRGVLDTSTVNSATEMIWRGM